MNVVGTRVRRLADALRALPGETLTEEGWLEHIAPVLERSPAGPSEDARAIIELYSKPDLRADDTVRRRMARFLGTHGYDVLESRPEEISDEAFASLIRESNVSERDEAFEALAQKVNPDGEPVIVGVIDMGFDTHHALLRSKLYGVSDQDDLRGPDPSDVHGNHVAGLVTRGTTRVRAMPLLRTTTGESIADAIDRAAEHGARIINLSLGFYMGGFRWYNTRQNAPIIAALRRHPEILFVAAAGNDGRDIARRPPDEFFQSSGLPNLVVVAGCDADGAPYPDSNYGAPCVALAARGTRVLSTGFENGYTFGAGTSTAAPFVSSVAGRALVLDPKLSPEELIALLIRCSKHDARWILPDGRLRVLAGGPLDESRVLQEVVALRAP
jgi:subtilisin family serine protease